MEEFFTPDSALTISIPNDRPDLVYSIPRPLIPRFFHTWSLAGLCSLHMGVERIEEGFLPTQHILFESPRARLLSGLEGGQQLVEHVGSLQVLFTPTSKVLVMELRLDQFEHYVSSKTENLFTIPLKGGFDPAVHHFLEMQTLLQASFPKFS